MSSPLSKSFIFTSASSPYWIQLSMLDKTYRMLHLQVCNQNIQVMSYQYSTQKCEQIQIIYLKDTAYLLSFLRSRGMKFTMLNSSTWKLPQKQFDMISFVQFIPRQRDLVKKEQKQLTLYFNAKPKYFTNQIC